MKNPHVGEEIYLRFEDEVVKEYEGNKYVQFGRYGKIAMVWREDELLVIYLPRDKWNEEKRLELSFDELHVTGSYHEESNRWELTISPELVA